MFIVFAFFVFIFFRIIYGISSRYVELVGGNDNVSTITTDRLREKSYTSS